jgi:hypothetical protein
MPGACQHEKSSKPKTHASVSSTKEKERKSLLHPSRVNQVEEERKKMRKQWWYHLSSARNINEKVEEEKQHADPEPAPSSGPHVKPRRTWRK